MNHELARQSLWDVSSTETPDERPALNWTMNRPIQGVWVLSVPKGESAGWPVRSPVTTGRMPPNNKAGRLRGMAVVFPGLCVAMALTGCAQKKQVETVRIANTRFADRTVAVAPAINLSGSRDFDPDRFADWMAVELGFADDLTVIPVSRVLAVLAAQGLDRIQTPAHALELCDWLGADAILVLAVTHYDPYDPPGIGITAQLYGKRPGTGGGTTGSDRASTATAPSGRAADDPEPLAHFQRVFDGSSQFVVADIQKFARNRGGEKSPYGWKKYLVSQQHFIRYCCNATIQALLSGEEEVRVAEGRKSERTP
jgi:hypothetical protein